MEMCSLEPLQWAGRGCRGEPSPSLPSAWGASPQFWSARPTPSLSSLAELSRAAAAAGMAPPWVPALGFTLVPSVGGFLGSYYVRGEGLRWYASLQKPTWHPPRWTLGPIWGTLYSAMG